MTACSGSGAQQVRGKSAIHGLFGGDPRQRDVEGAVGDAVGLRVRREHPFVDAQRPCGSQRRADAVGQPADVTQAHRSALRAGPLQPLLGVVDKRQNPAPVVQQRTSGFAQPHAAPVPHEQVGPQFPFQRDDLLGQSRSGDVHPLGGAPEVQLLGDRDEIAQLPQFHRPELTVYPRWRGQYPMGHSIARSGEYP